MSETYLYGIHSVQAALNQSKRSVQLLLIEEGKSSGRIKEIIEQANQRNIPIHFVSELALKQTVGEVSHQGIALRVGPMPLYTEQDLERLLESTPSPLFLVLDNVTDPHNLGACLRTANASGVDCVIIPKDKSASPQNPIVNKVACGAVEFTPCLAVTNLARTLKQLQQAGVWIYGTAGEAEQTLWSTSFSGPIALVMGSEGLGLRRLTREHCDVLFSIPMQGTVESLNVSVATGICLYEVARQRNSPMMRPFPLK